MFLLNVAVPVLLFVLIFSVSYMFMNRNRMHEPKQHVKKAPKWFRPIAQLSDAAGLSITADRWLFYTAIGVVAGAIGGYGLKNVFVGMLLCILFGYLPTFFISYKATRYRMNMMDSLSSGIEVFSAEYVAVKNLARSFDHASKQLPEPIKSEFARIAREMYTGYRVHEVLEGFRRRVNNRWARQFVNLLLLREERGADIEDGLFNLVKQMKTNQIETQREKAEMAQTRMIHLILMISAMGLFLYNLPGNYEFVTTEPLGRSIVTVVAVLLLVSLAIFILLDRKEVE